MRKIKVGAGPLFAIAMLAMGAGLVATAVIAQMEPEVAFETSLPLARI